MAGAVAAIMGAAGWVDVEGTPRNQGTTLRSPGCSRPYTAWSPWNTSLVGAVHSPDSAARVSRISGGPLTSDPTQYTYPVYYVHRSTSRVQVKLDGWFSHVGRRGQKVRNQRGGSVRLPIPPGAGAAAGSDGQIILIDAKAGDEWGLWQMNQNGPDYGATNGSPDAGSNRWNWLEGDVPGEGVPGPGDTAVFTDAVDFTLDVNGQVHRSRTLPLPRRRGFIQERGVRLVRVVGGV